MVGSLGKFWLGNRLIVNIDKPELFEIILNEPTCLDKGESYKYISNGLGNGLVTLKGKAFVLNR